MSHPLFYIQAAFGLIAVGLLMSFGQPEWEQSSFGFRFVVTLCCMMWFASGVAAGMRWASDQPHHR